MKKSLLSLAALSLCGVMAFGADQVPAFPGAEGHGRYTQGGRGGKVIHVTNLNDSGEGSLRWALGQSGKKIIVFDVGGYIDLKSNLQTKDNTTIAGQTAPYPGITLRYYTLENKGNNVIVRFIRSRRSQVKDVNDGADAYWGRQRQNIIIDHCSFSWAIDEVASFYDNKFFTMQWCSLGEALANPGHTKGQHSYGGIWGGKQASFHHNYLTHMQNRVPRFNGARYGWGTWGSTEFLNTVDAERVDFRNNVMYNWGTGGCYGGPGGGYINMVNNYYKAGPGTRNKDRVTQVSVNSSSVGDKSHTELYDLTSRYYISGNYVTGAKDGEPANYDWKGVIYDGGVYTIDGERYCKDVNHMYGEDKEYKKNTKGEDCIRIRLDEPINAGEVMTQTAEQAYENVLLYVGSSLHRDGVDARYMEEARTGTVTYNGDVPLPGKTAKSGTKGIIDWVNDPDGEQNPGVASYPALESTSRPEGFDTDGDGMPNEWETAHGLNPDDPEDGALFTLDTKGWYCNLEVYLSTLVEDIMKGGNAGSINGFAEYYPLSGEYNPSGIEEVAVKAEGEVVGFEYYDLRGVRLSEPAQGISIRRMIYSNGTVVTDKVMKK